MTEDRYYLLYQKQRELRKQWRAASDAEESARAVLEAFDARYGADLLAHEAASHHLDDED